MYLTWDEFEAVADEEEERDADERRPQLLVLRGTHRHPALQAHRLQRKAKLVG